MHTISKGNISQETKKNNFKTLWKNSRGAAGNTFRLNVEYITKPFVGRTNLRSLKCWGKLL